MLSERERMVRRDEILRLRMESVVDAIQLTHAKILQIAASNLLAEPEAQRQIGVFLDGLVREVEIVAESVRAVEEIVPPNR